MNDKERFLEYPFGLVLKAFKLKLIKDGKQEDNYLFKFKDVEFLINVKRRE